MWTQFASDDNLLAVKVESHSIKNENFRRAGAGRVEASSVPFYPALAGGLEINTMSEKQELLHELIQSGRSLFDTMQKNLSWQVSRTDEDIAANPDPMDEVFGSETPEEYRAMARRTQDKLDRQGREAFAEEYAQTQIKNVLA
jgi:hypothetical protein